MSSHDVQTATRQPGPQAAPPGGRQAARKEEALWLLERFAPGTGVNNLSVTIEVDGRLDRDATAVALGAVVRRHESLSTAFTAGPDGLRKQVVTAAEIAVDEDALPPADALEAALSAYVGTPFPLDGTPLVRARISHGEGRDVLCIVVHHLVFDTISVTPFLEDFVAAYDAPGSLGTAQVAAVDDPKPSERSQRFWRGQLADFASVSPELLIGSDAGASTSLLGQVHTAPLADEVVAGVRALQKQLRASEAVVLLAGFYALLARHGAGPDLVVGSPVTSRPQDAPDAIGYHINVVPMRTQVDPDAGFDKLVRKTRSVFMGSITHADVSVDSMQGEVERTTSGWRNTLFRHVFNFVPDIDAEAFELGGLPARTLNIENGYSKFDLEFFVLPSDDGIRLRVAYHRDAFTAEQVELLVERYEALLAAGCSSPGTAVAQLPMLGRTDRAVIEAANDTGNTAAPGLLAEFAARVAETPDACAVRQDGVDVDYAHLAGAAQANADALHAAGVTPGDVVGVAVSRSAELAAAALGCWLAGTAYLPIDPAHPHSRIAYQFEDSGARAVLRSPGLELPVGDDVTVVDCADTETAAPLVNVSTRVAPSEIAYLIYTSGSTGKPKGTRLTHGNLDNLIAAFRADLDADRATTTLWSTTFTFDISALELFLPLAGGATLVVAGDADRHDGARLRRLVVDNDVRVVQATPTAWRLVIDELAADLEGRIVLCGGEPMPPELARRLVGAGAELRNVYGPTETCIWSTAGPVREDDLHEVTVGVPLRNTQVFVADAHGSDLPLHVPGELCIAGDGVCAGYHERPELNDTRFGEHPTFGRFYRTGDRARWRSDGRLQVLGRADRQIKLRGMRIELGEIETVLRAHDAVRNAGVVVVGDTSTADAALIAFVEAGTAGGVDADQLWRHAREELPRALLPQDFVLVDALPTNAAHKIDYPELTRWAETQQAQQAQLAQQPAAIATGVEESDPLVATLVELWQQTLGRVDVDADTNFFAHGGHSLLAVRLVQSIVETTQHEIALPDLFASPTPREVATLLTQRGPLL